MFPSVIAPLEDLWVTWVIKTMALKPTYLAMLAVLGVDAFLVVLRSGALSAGGWCAPNWSD